MDIGDFTFIANVQKRQPERFQRPEKCKRDNIMGSISNILTPTSTRQHVWMPTHLILQKNGFIIHQIVIQLQPLHTYQSHHQVIRSHAFDSPTIRINLVYHHWPCKDILICHFKWPVTRFWCQMHFQCCMIKMTCRKAFSSCLRLQATGLRNPYQ